MGHGESMTWWELMPAGSHMLATRVHIEGNQAPPPPLPKEAYAKAKEMLRLTKIRSTSIEESCSPCMIPRVERRAVKEV